MAIGKAPSNKAMEAMSQRCAGIINLFGYSQSLSGSKCRYAQSIERKGLLRKEDSTGYGIEEIDFDPDSDWDPDKTILQQASGTRRLFFPPVMLD